MRSRPILALALAGTCAALAASPATAQQTIRAGQTVNGRLEASDATLDDGSHYEIWNYRGRAGERVTITLRSSDFDAYLAFGRMSGGECQGDCDTDDDGAGGTDARVVATLREDGVYQIRANTLSDGETGSYTLSVESGAAPPPPGPAGTITLGQTVSGRLDADDAQAGDDSFYELWTFRGRPGDRVTITLRSSDFDAYLGWGRMSGGGEWEEIDSDDDGAGGTDARLEVTVGDQGTYVIRANTLSSGETGSYTLQVEAGGSGGDGGDDGDGDNDGGESEEVDLSRAREIRPGAPMSGELDGDDPQLGDESYYELYTFTGRAGDRVTITMRSDDFDTFLALGRAVGGRFEAVESNDDGDGEGTNSRLEVTLPANGQYVIRANSLAGSDTGAYTIELRSAR
jgi:hypothetical protein